MSTAPLAQDDPYLTAAMIVEIYPFLRSKTGSPSRRIYRLIDLGHFPKKDGKAGRLLLWRQSTIEAWIADGMPQVTE